MSAHRLKEFTVMQPSTVAKAKIEKNKEKLRQLSESWKLIELNKHAHLKADCEKPEPWLRMGCGESFIVRGLEGEKNWRVKASRVGKFWRAKFWVIKHTKMQILEIVRIL